MRSTSFKALILVITLLFIFIGTIQSEAKSEKRRLEKERSRLIELKKKSEKAKRELERTIRKQKKLKKNVESLNRQMRRKETLLKRVNRELTYVEKMLQKYDKKIMSLKKKREILSHSVNEFRFALVRSQSKVEHPLYGFVEKEKTGYLMALLLTKLGKDMEDVSRRERKYASRLDRLEGSRKYWEGKDRSWRERKEKIASIRAKRKRELRKVAERKAAIEKKYRRIERNISSLQKTVASIERKIKAGKKVGKFLKSRPTNYTFPARGKVVSRFGKTRDREFDIYIENKGIEIRGKKAAAIRAVSDGKVVYQGILSGFGKVTVIEHRGDIFSVYGRARLYNVKVGDRVKKGQKIGIMDKSSGPSLYFELRVGGRPVNPLRYINIPRG